MKQTIEDYIRLDKEFRKTLLEQGGGIMKFWAQHPDAEFDADLFNNYENQIVKEYLQANKRNRDVASLPENELKMEARSWNHHTEKEIHYKVVLQPLMTELPVGVREQVNSYIDDYLADAYRDYRRCFYPNGITPQAFYDEVVKQFGTGGLARDCMDYVLREHYHPEVWAKKKSEYALMMEFFIQQYSEVIGKGAFKMLRQAVKEKLAGKNSEECRQEAIKTMNLVKGFSRMIYSSAEVGISDCTGRYIVDKKYLRELTGTNAALRLLSNAKVSPLHECFFNYVTLLNDIGRIWSARLLKYYGIDMHKLEKETGAILYPVTKPLQNPDGAVHGNYKYYVDKDFSDSLDDQCCIYDEKQAKELLDAMRKERKSENLANQLRDSIMQLVDNINKKPELVINLGKLAAKTKFDWSFMNAIICGLSEKWLMDKAIQVMVDIWNEHVSRKDEICYTTVGYTTMYDSDEHGIYSKRIPMMKTLKYVFLEQNLKAVRDGELERRKVNEQYEKELKKKEAPAPKKPKKYRMKWERNNIHFSFNYNPDDIVDRNPRLIQFYKDLKYLHLIDDNTEQKLFFDMFSGRGDAEGKNANRILWTGHKRQLKYLIKTLADKGWLSWKTGPKIWQMTSACFCKMIVNENGESELACFEGKEFSGDYNWTTDYPLIDIIVKLLDPKSDYVQIHEELEDAYIKVEKMSKQEKYAERMHTTGGWVDETKVDYDPEDDNPDA